MPPIKHLIENDKKFYGSIKPSGVGDPNKLEYPAPPPNPASKIPLTNDLQRNIETEKLTADLSTAENLEARVKPPAPSSELNIKDTKKIELSGFSKFIENPLGLDQSKSMETEARLDRQGREVVGFDEQGPNWDGLRQVRNDLVDKPIEAVGDTVASAYGFVENKIVQGVLLLGGIYLASIVVNNITKKTKED